VEKGLKRLIGKKKIIERYGYYSLIGRSKNIQKRIDKLQTSQAHMHSAKWIVRLFKLVPWIQLVGISGNLAMDNADEYDDIDLFVITQKKRLWISRLSILFILSLLEKRRRRSDSRKSAAGKFCLNLLLEEDQLEQTRKDLYIAHEVLQMRPIWERSNIYSIFLNQNSWAFDYLPNWLTGFQGYSGTKKKNSSGFKLTDLIETVVSFLQPPIYARPRLIGIFSELNLPFTQAKYLMATIPIVIYAVMRYLYIIYEKKEGESPERVLLTDKPLLFTVILYSLTTIAIIYFLGS